MTEAAQLRGVLRRIGRAIPPPMDPAMTDAQRADYYLALLRERTLLARDTADPPAVAALPPAALAAEMQLLGDLLRNRAQLVNLVGLLEPEHFADPLNGAVFRVLRGLAAHAVNVRLPALAVAVAREAEGPWQAHLAYLLSLGMLPADDVGPQERALEIVEAWIERTAWAGDAAS